MHDEPLPESDMFGPYFSFSRQGRHVDFLRVYPGRIEEGKREPISEESRDEVQSVLFEVGELIREYSWTAKRVGSEFDEILLMKVIYSLIRESMGDPGALAALSNENSTEKFLAESLHNEILDVFSRKYGANRSSGSSAFTQDDWRTCLNVLAESLFSEPESIAP